MAALIAVLALLAGAPGSAADGPLATGRLVVQGSRLSLYADAETTDADQTINVGERARVRTCFGGVNAPCGAVLPGDPRVAGLAVRAELRGPEVPEGLPLETLPGGTFVLPGLQQEGDYRLENIRLVEAATDRVLGASQPAVAVVRVREIVLTSATVRALSLEELRARGIAFTEGSFQAFDFAVGFAFGSETVEIKLPIVYDGYEPVKELEKPEVVLDGLPDHVVAEVKRWQPPRIVPFVLEREEPDGPRLQEEGEVALRFPVFGAIVLPGGVSYLNQFFEAKLIVANGAPAGSAVDLTDLAASVRLPGGNVLRVVASEPSVAAGQAVPLVSATGGRILGPGEQGSAAWTVEGLETGTHTLAIDVTGQIDRPGRDPLPVLSRSQAAVEVVDARFNLAFSHPDVVREGEAYSLFVTVTNLSRAGQSLITVDLDEQHVTGAHPEDPQDTLRRTIDTLEPGQAQTLEYRLVAELDGKVVATTFQSSSAAGQGTIELRTGVGELGIPLSPATLVLPRFSELLDAPHVSSGGFLRANVRFLGLAYSLAVAPSAHVPADLPRVIRSDVERRAVDLGQAGHRIFLGERLLEALEVLALDQLGNRRPLTEIDALRRRLAKGEAVAAELAALLRGEQAARGLDALDLLDHLAATASYTDPWLAAVVVPDGSGDLPALAIRRATAEGVGVLSGVAGGGAAVRTLPFGEVYGVSEHAAGGEIVPLALVGHLEEGERFDVVLSGGGGTAAAGRLVLVLPDGGDPGSFRRVDLGRVEVPAGGAVAVEVGAQVPGPSSGGFGLFDPATGAPVAGSASQSTVQWPPFRVIGAVQDFRLDEKGPDALGNMFRPNRYGNGLVYLFNRPPDTASLDPAAFRIRSTFDGLDTAAASAHGSADRVGDAAWVQDDPRVVAVRYTTPISSLIDPSTGGALVRHEQLLDTPAFADARGERLDPNVPAPRLETVPLHVGGLVDGRVVRGTGEPAGGSRVQLIRIWLKETILGIKEIPELVGEVTTGADGRFYFDFVESPHWDPKVTEVFRLRAIVPEGDDPELEPAVTEQVSSRIRLQNRLAHVDIALLGRGAVTGELVYQDTGEPVPDGSVTATSTLFGEERSAVAAADGSFRIGGLPVGPITVTGRDRDGRSVYATVGIEEPGSTVHVRLEMPRAPPALGTVTGRVVRLSTGDPVSGARVAAYNDGHGVGSELTDDFGRFRFDDLPAGRISLQAAYWEVSRSSAVDGFLLGAGETRDVTLRLADAATRAVEGSVLFHDPVTNSDVPVAGAVAFISGPGVFAYTGTDGRYRIEGVPVQGVTDTTYRVQVIDYARELQGAVPLPPVLDTSPDVIQAQSVVLERMRGGVDGVVLDPLGRPIGGTSVKLYATQETETGPDGSFSFEGVSIGTHQVLAHVEDGLQAGRVGYFGAAKATVVYGGHRPFVTVRMVGSGVVSVHTGTSTATGILTPIYYKPTFFDQGGWKIKLKGAHIESTTDPNGDLELVLPVGEYEVVAYNPFHGVETVRGRLTYQGQAQRHEIVFEDAATVAGRVLDVDGTTPVAGIEVTLEVKGLLPQTQRTDAQGGFRFELVPKGPVSVSAAGLVGTVERVGRTASRVTLGGQELELDVRLKAQGTVRGRVMERFNEELRPLPFAQYAVRESSWPFRRLPADGSWFLTDEEGRYQVSHLSAGSVTVVARDSSQVSRAGTARGSIEVDWQVVDLPDIVMSTSIGSLEVLVRDPETGGPVPDAQVRLSIGEWTVSDPDGVAYFDALALGTYSVYAFHAPTGRSGRLDGLGLSAPGEHRSGTVYLDQRGEVRGTLYDDPSRTVGVPAGTVRLSGQTAGGSVVALTTTSSEPGAEGDFSFLGIPEGRYALEAAVQTSSRRARAEATLTETAPVAEVVMVLEPVRDVWVRLFESLAAGVVAVDPATGLFSVRVQQGGYDFTRATPEPGSDLYRFPEVLETRGGTLSAIEQSGEQRSVSATFGDFQAAPPVDGDGSAADPYRLVLRPKGAVIVSVLDAGGSPVSGAEVTLQAPGERFPSVTGADGRVTFASVPAGFLSVSATSPTTGTGGRSTGTLTYDDEVVELSVTLAPAVAAHGVVYQPVADDRWSGDVAELVPAAGIIVQIHDSAGDTQTVLTGEDGTYRFDVLPTGAYSLNARDANGDQLATVSGSLSGPDGFDNTIPGLILDAAPPRIVSLVPPPGFEGVSRSAVVEILFSEPLAPAVLPTGQATSPYFRLASADGVAAAGTWDSGLDASGFQVVRFVPSVPYQNFATYTLTISGGPGGVRDRVGRPLTAAGDVGSNFKTSDAVGPEVVATEPSLDLPVDPAVPIRFDFNEALRASDEQLDGDGVDDAAELYALTETGEVRLPVLLYLTRSGYSLTVEAQGGFTVTGDTGRRRLVLTGLTDAYGNPMPVYERSFRLYDQNPPVLDAVPFPDNAPDGRLVQGVAYLLVPVLSNLDDLTPERPGGDVARVDYFFQDPSDPTRPVAPAFSATEPPFAYPFTGVYGGDGVEPWPFPVWARAIDTSTNVSNVVEVAMVVEPNAPPEVGSVSVEAVAPVAGTLYAGSSVSATVAGLADADDSQLTLSVELWAGGVATPLAEAPDRQLLRPESGWAALPQPSFDFTLPLDLAEGTPVWARATAIDSQGAEGTLESEPVPVADDATPPPVDGVAAKLAGGGVETIFYLGESFYFELRSEDGETAVAGVTVALDRTDLFPEPPTMAPVDGTAGLYRSSALAVPVDLVTEEIPVVASFRVVDVGGNETVEELAFAVAPEPDPTAPVGEWVSPWAGAPWPAEHTSVLSADGAALLLRVEAADAAEDEAGNLLPGNLVSVRFRGPVRDPATGQIGLASTWIDGEPVPGTEAPGRGTYRALWRVPDGIAAGTEIPFEVRVVDGGGTATVEQVRMTARPARRVYEGAITAVAPEDPMLAAGGDPLGAVFLLDGATLSLRPQTDGSVRHLPALHALTGGSIDEAGVLTAAGSVLTAPEITTYDSAVLYHPLELAVDEALTVAHGSRIDMTGRGLLGSTSTREMVLPGETGAEAWAGGSHGGRGGAGSPAGGWDRTDLAAPGSVYDNLRDPRLPGGGGAGPSGTPGGAGGGVVRLLAGGASVRLDGDLLAAGGQGAGGGGAGGSIRLVAGRLEGGGTLSAAGGPGSDRLRAGGGAGGRVAVSVRELGPEVDLAAQVDVSGGHNDWHDPDGALQRGGAGTSYVELLDGTGSPAGPGRVSLANPEGLPPAVTPLPALGDGSVIAADPEVDPGEGELTLDAPGVRGDLVGEWVVLVAEDGASLGELPIVGQQRVADPAASSGFVVRLRLAAAAGELDPVAAELAAGRQATGHARARLETVAAAGAVRLAVDDDLLLGPADDPSPSLNERSALELSGSARALLRGEGPGVTVTSDPAAGAELLLGGSVEVSWQADDPLGIASTSTEWSVDSAPVETGYADPPAALAGGPRTLTIPADAEPGAVTFAVEATDLAGRSERIETGWTVLPNQAPSTTLALGSAATVPAPAGYALPVVVTATDREGLAALTLLASGPVSATSRSTEVSGTSAEVVFEVEVLATADGSEPVVLQAVAEDLSGATTTSDTLSVEVAANDAPSGSLAFAAGAGERVKPGESTTVQVTAADPDGLQTIELQVTGPATSAGETRSVAGLDAVESFTVTAAVDAPLDSLIRVTAAVTDSLGASLTTASLDIPVVSDSAAPEVTLTLDPDAARVTAGDVVRLAASATDDASVTSLVLTVDGGTVASSSGGAISHTWTAPPVAGPTVVRFEAEAVDPGGNRGTAVREVTVDPRDDQVPPDVTFTCPTGGALFPLGHEASLAVHAADDLGVARVDFFVGAATEPFATATPASGGPAAFDGSATLPLPETAGETRVRAEVVDFGNNRSEVEIALSTVQTVDLAADGAGTNDWTALAGQVAVLRSGTLSLDRPVSLGGLILLPGASVTKSSSLPPAGSVRLDVSGPVYLACGAAVDVSKRGYPAYASYPEHGGPGQYDGGSHIGMGGSRSLPAGETFGSVYRPQEAGGGGDYRGVGGGVVRIVAGRLHVDGAIRADGQSADRGGAGGSVWVTATTVAGGGSITAGGGNGQQAYYQYGNGGGGAIAVEYGGVDPGATLLDSLAAATYPSGYPGGAGSVYLLGPDAVHGELILDNGGSVGETVLPALGAGVAGAGSGGSVLETGLADPVPAYFVGHWVEVYDGATGTLEGTARVSSISGTVLTLDGGVDVTPGDAWQGVYRFDRFTVTGGAVLTSDDPIRGEGEVHLPDGSVSGSVEASTVVVEAGTAIAREVRADLLRVLPGATLSHPATTDPEQPESLLLVVDELVVEAGGAIDASSRGYRPGTSYPGHVTPGNVSGGSHIGEGGVYYLPAGQTFGSVYRPQEPGGGGQGYGVGGGVVRILAGRLQVDGAVRANGQHADRGGAGGAVWITASSLAGSGSIEARGGRGVLGYYQRGDGGGGAISVEYGGLEPGTTLLGSISAAAQDHNRPGGAGSVYLSGPGSTFGDLILDNGGVQGKTVLPALGAGVALAGSGGGILLTDLSEPIPAYFVGHWVEIYDSATGVLKGTARIASVDGAAATLETDPGVTEGDLWQGVYRFDSLQARNGAVLTSDDPIRGYSELRFSDDVELDVLEGSKLVIEAGTVRAWEVRADLMVIRAGARLAGHLPTSPAQPEPLIMQVGELVLEEGAAIDVSRLGYGADLSYPGHGLPGSYSGGSHIGEGGVVNAPAAESFGSVYRPQEAGGGGWSWGSGGGVLRIDADRLQLDGVVAADGERHGVGTGGGSIWLTTDVLAGTGSIRANGGAGADNRYGAGGGGAVALRYSSLEAGSTILDTLTATAGASGREGGAGSVYVQGPGSIFGHLVLDNGGRAGLTRLPSLGAGVAGEGSAGSVLVSDLAAPIPPYFVGHWVELYDGGSGEPKGVARIAALEGSLLHLEADLGVAAGDLWQGVYRFDRVQARNGAVFASDDPVRGHTELRLTDGVELEVLEASEVIIEPGTVETREVSADLLRIRSGGTLRRTATVDPAQPRPLVLEVGELIVEEGGVVDVSTLGYGPDTAYPGHQVPGTLDGGSHLGVGAVVNDPAGETFGSVYRPREPGGGGYSWPSGGGVVRIAADRVQIDGTIAADGRYQTVGGAGGSVWITAGELAGSGSIRADGARAYSTSYGAGGGGAIAVEYQLLAPGATLLDTLSATTGSYGKPGGAGSVYLLGPGATYGDLVVDNGGAEGVTDLPALGAGVAQAGTAGATVVTDRAASIPPYFVGHWVAVEAPAGGLKGTWRIGSVDGATFTLEPNGTETISLEPGDLWSGRYRFDAVTVTGGAVLQSGDPVIEAASGAVTAARAWGNADAPTWNPAGVTVAPDFGSVDSGPGAEPGWWSIRVAPSALSDSDGIAEVRLSDGAVRLALRWSPTEGVTFPWPAEAGREPTLTAIDRHGLVRASASLRLRIPSHEPSPPAMDLVPAAGETR